MADKPDVPEEIVDDEKAKTSKKKSKSKSSAAAKQPEKPAEKEKKPTKGLSKVKEEIERRRKEEERLRQQEEEEDRKFEEEQRKRKEAEELEQKKKDEKKRKQKEKRDALKAQGLLLTDKQKEDRRKIMEMLEARGMKVGPGEDATAEQTKKPKINKKKPHRKTSTEESRAQKASGEKAAEAAAAGHHSESEESGLDDWEDLAETLEQQHLDSVPSTASIDDQKQIGSDRPKATFVHETLTEEDKAALISSARARIKEHHKKYEAERNINNLRSGVICVLGHVDTGKTKILDKLRNTNVQDREAGGITQQIGATNVPSQNICDATKMCRDFFDTSKMILPGLLIIDTPGHESFSNLRIRGSSLCDMAILVVDLMHSLEEQTKESIKILAARKTPFVVALNKIDRLYGWQSSPKESVVPVIARQSEATMNDFNDRLKQVISDFAVMELNARLFYDKPAVHDDESYVKMVPTSAHSGDGMGDLLAYICRTLEKDLAPRIAYSRELTASVMEVKEIDGLGTTIDVIVVNGELNQGDQIVLTGTEGPIVTQIRSLLQPAPMSEMRVKALNYQHLKSIKGAQGVKVTAKGLEHALPGLPLYVAHDVAQELYFKHKVEKGLDEALKAIQVSSLGVYVMASTLGSLESLLVYLKSTDIPYSGINIGTVHKKDVIKASIMLQRDPKWAIILAFDVKVDREAAKMAADMNIKIFTSEIIYNLQDQMQKYFEELKNQNRIKHRDQAVFPVRLRILPDMVFNKRAPIVMGVRVDAGILKVGTPLCVPTKECVQIGKVFSIEINHKNIEEARTGQEVCIRVDPLEGETPKMFGRHFEQGDEIVSKISRLSIDVMKEYFREDLTKDEWRLMAELKKHLGIP